MGVELKEDMPSDYKGLKEYLESEIKEARYEIEGFPGVGTNKEFAAINDLRNKLRLLTLFQLVVNEVDVLREKLTRLSGGT